MNFRLVKCGRDRKHTTHKPQRGSSGKERVNNSRILRGSQREMFFRRPPATPSIKEGLRLLNLFQMICFSFHLLPHNEKVFPFLRTEPLRAQSEKLSKESLRAQTISKRTRKVSAIAKKSLWIHMRSRFRREALSGLDRITNVESKSLSTHTHAHKRREKEREGERSFVEFLAST